MFLFARVFGLFFLFFLIVAPCVPKRVFFMKKSCVLFARYKNKNYQHLITV